MARRIIQSFVKIHRNFGYPALLESRTLKPTLRVSNSKICISPRLISLVQEPNIKPQIKIIDPILRIINSAPPLKDDKDFILPTNDEDKDITEPSKVYEKKAARLIIIRRAKMKKHKWRKLQKKMKFVFAKIRQKREMKKEKAFQAVLIAQVKAAEKFDPQEYVLNQINLSQWKPPVTRIRGFYAPDSVIEEFSKMEKEKAKMDKRIADCIRRRKL